VYASLDFSVFRYRWIKNGLKGPEMFPGLSRNGSQRREAAIRREVTDCVMII